MFKGYKELEALSPEVYLDWQRFETPFDLFSENLARDLAGKQYQTGLDYGRKSTAVHIATNGTWSARMADGGSLTSCEGIGYHACTKDLLHGFIDSGACILVHRWTDAGLVTTKIQ